MKFCTVKPTGEIVQTGYCADSATLDDLAPCGDTPILDIPENVRFDTHYYATGTFSLFGDRPSDLHEWDWSSHSWVIKSTALDDAKAAQSVAINTACRDQIYAGFESVALGATHHYPAKAQDQANLVASVTASILPANSTDWTTPFWCCDQFGVWDYVQHTASQIQQAGADGKAAILDALGKNEYLQRQIAVATSIDNVRAITW